MAAQTATQKNIVLCSDGTGNAGGKKNGTNVWRLFLAVDTVHTPPGQPRQAAFHDDGVGTQEHKFLKAIGGATGFGLGANIRHLYASLVRCYNFGDQIFLFGFSRGAYTVRSVCGFIHHCGILKRDACATAGELTDKVEELYAIYRKTNWDDTAAAAAARAKLKSYDRHKSVGEDEEEGFRITFLGVWDTVDAIGVPVDELRGILKFVVPPMRDHAHDLNSSIEYAYHALAIDDMRLTFHPLLFDEQKAAKDATVEQVWFSGVHSNVGGGYPKDQLALVTLDWMMNKAKSVFGGGRQPLRFIRTLEDQYHEGANVDGKLYDSRSGLGSYYRYTPREIAGPSKKKTGNIPVFHESVFTRIRNRTDGYAPLNVPTDCQTIGQANNGKPTPFETHGAKTEDATRLATRLSRWQVGLYFVILLVSLFFVAYLASANIMSQASATIDKGYLIPSLRMILPDFLSNWIVGAVGRFDYLLLFTGLYIFLVFFFRQLLRNLITDVSGMGWRHWYLRKWLADPANANHRNRLANEHEATDIEAKIRKIGNSRRKAVWELGNIGKRYWRRALIALLLVAGGLYMMTNRVQSRWHFDLACATLHHGENRDGATHFANFLPKDPCFRTDLRLTKGQAFAVDVTVREKWRDKTIPAGPDGFKDKADQEGWLMSLWSRVLRSRQLASEKQHDYFDLMGQVVTADNGAIEPASDPFRIGGAGDPVTSPADGTLVLFVNDIDCRWCPFWRFAFYDNNKGTATIAVRRLP